MSRLSQETKAAIQRMNAEGKTEKQIAAALCIPQTTAAYHCLYGGRGPTPRVIPRPAGGDARRRGTAA
jgi:hypothetical protein